MGFHITFLIYTCRRDVGSDRPIQVTMTQVGMGGEIADAIGARCLGDVVASLPELIEEASCLVRVATLKIREGHIAPVARLVETVVVVRVGETVVKPSSVAGILLVILGRIFEEHVVIPLGKRLVLGEIIQRRGGWHPLDTLHVKVLVTEIGPISHAMAGEVAIVRMLVLGIVDVVTMAVEPILSSTTCLAQPSEDAGIPHLVVAECHTEQIEATPTLHRLARRLLSVAIAIAHTTGKGVTCPRVEGTEERILRVLVLPVGVILGHLAKHLTIVVTEVIIDQRQQGTRQGEITVMEMMVVEGVGVETGGISHQGTPTVIASEEIVFLSRGIGEPVDHHFLESLAALLEEFFLAHLPRHHHVERHLGQSLSSPIGV